MYNCKQDSGKRRYKLLVLIVLIAAVTAFIWRNSMSSIEQSKQLSGGIMEFIKSIIDPYNKLDSELFHIFVRKAAHFTEFLVLAVLYVLIRENSGRLREKFTLLPPFATLFTAVIDEFIQSFTGRGTQVQDVLVDFVGALFGIAVTTVILNLKNKGKN